MIPTLGHAAILVGLAASAFAVAAFLIGHRQGSGAALAAARRGMYVTFAAAVVAAAAMVVSLLAHDFSVSYVARNNSTTTPPWISFVSLWAALEGSILLWALLLTGIAALVVHRYRSRHPALMPVVGAVLATVSVFFFLVLAIPGNPFVRVTPVASEGPGPNALLQNHPFMALHPPLLYIGYVGLVVPFAFCVAALVAGRTDEGWLAIVRRWTLIPWIFLTLGIVAGAWWSYEVLGWGGYWAWDPVENAALLPWLTATAFIHSSMVGERRRSLRTWNAALIIATFQLTLIGTFLTRSGVVASVHSFTQSAIGPFFLAGLVISLVASLSILVWRLPMLRDEGAPPATVSRESAFLFNNLLFLGLTFAVLFGTLLPLGVEAFGGGKISVGAPWFNGVGVPIVLALLFLMGVGPALPWGAASVRTLRERFGVPLVVAAGAALAPWLLGVRAPAAMATLALTGFAGTVMLEEFVRGSASRARRRDEAGPLAAWRLATRNRRRYGGYGVHLGILVMAVAVAVSSTLGTDVTRTLAPGDELSIAGYTVRLERLVVEPLAANPAVTEARAEVSYRGAAHGTMSPALRRYPSDAQLIATPAVRSTFGEDLYLTLMGYDPASGAASLHVFVNPLVGWIWLGGGVVGAAAVFAIWPDRRRGAAATAPQPVAAPLPSRGRPTPVVVDAAVADHEVA
ncbi:MAG: cytochrome c biogenesis protein CcsA [Chloroflexota bacterium]|nr:cytochrome c biogenesis protein CcsA [Chloroflexota bacterium]